MRGTFDRYEPGASRLHRLDAPVKLVATLAWIIATVLLPDGSWLAFALSWLLLLAANGVAQLGWGYTLRRSLIALPFALTALTLVWTLPGPPLVSVQIGPWLLVMTTTGVVRFASILVRSWLAVQIAILLVATTPFVQLLAGLRRLHLPGVLVAIIGFMYRYLSVLADETQRLLRARASRSGAVAGQRAGGTLRWRARVAGHLAGQLFLRSYERSERVYAAMLARGYAGEWRTLPTGAPRHDWALVAMLGVAMLVVQAVGWWRR